MDVKAVKERANEKEHRKENVQIGRSVGDDGRQRRCARGAGRVVASPQWVPLKLLVPEASALAAVLDRSKFPLAAHRLRMNLTLQIKLVELYKCT